MTEIKVGDTVRIKDNYPYATGGNNVGVEFKVTDVVGGGGGTFYVTGDPSRRGIWVNFLERVEDPRWRYNDHIVVYPETRDQPSPFKANNTLGRGVTILDETPLPKVYTRWEGQALQESGEITEAARAYWEAHPLPKPAWHTPDRGEAWELTVNGDTGVFLVVWNPWDAMQDEYIFQAGNGTKVDCMSDEITAGRRIYPEAGE